MSNNNAHPYGFTPEQQQLYEEFANKVKDVTDDTSVLVRFFTARKHDVNAAEQQIRAAYLWRKEQKIDTILDQLPPNSELMKKLIPHAFHKNDKKGRPLYIERTGEIDVPLFLNLIPTLDAQRNHFFGAEYQLRRCKENSEKFDRPIYQTVNIMDLKGMGNDHKKGLPFLQQISKMDQDYFPECLGKLYVVNAPWIFPVLWKIARTFVDPVTRTKVEILGSDYKEKLLEDFDADCLPVEYGGTDPLQVPHYVRENLNPESYDPPLIDVTVAAGSAFEEVVDSSAQGVTVSWFFRTKNKDIQFAVKWLPRLDNHETKEVIVAPLTRVNSHEVRIEGTYTTKGAGSLILCWDNSHSMFTSKALRYHIEKVDDEQEAKTN